MQLAPYIEPSATFFGQKETLETFVSAVTRRHWSSTKHSSSQAALSYPRVTNSDLRKSRIAEDMVFHEQWTDTEFHYCGISWVVATSPPTVAPRTYLAGFSLKLHVGLRAFPLCSAIVKHSRWDFSQVRSTGNQTAKYSMILSYGQHNNNNNEICYLMFWKII